MPAVKMRWRTREGQCGASCTWDATMEMASWLRSLGLERYEAAFRENEIDDTILPRLTAEDLKELGVGPVGHRRKLLDAIADLRADSNAPLPAPSPPAPPIAA